jgi:lysophospholipase L1-like esterase
MLKNLTIILVFVFIIILFFYFKKDAPITNLDSPNQTIVAFGDSFVSGVGSTQGNDLVSLISKEIGEPIINLGVSGNTSAMGLERISEVIDQNPRLVFVLFGGNDFLRKVPIETTFQNIDDIVVQLQNAGSAVVLLGIKGGVLNDSYAERFKEIAKNRNVIYVPNVLQGLVGDSTLMSDAIHPNNTGYKLISEKIMKEVRKYF